jgi:hypothetical protein
MNACVTCKHKVRDLMSLFTNDYLECKHPSIPVNRITGKPGTQFCSIQRRGFGACGPEGRLYDKV